MRIKLVKPKITPTQQAEKIISELCVAPDEVHKVNDIRVLEEVVFLLKTKYRFSNAAKVEFFREDIRGETTYSLKEMEIATNHGFNVFP